MFPLMEDSSAQRNMTASIKWNDQTGKILLREEEWFPRRMYFSLQKEWIIQKIVCPETGKCISTTGRCDALTEKETSTRESAFPQQEEGYLKQKAHSTYKMGYYTGRDIFASGKSVHPREVLIPHWKMRFHQLKIVLQQEHACPTKMKFSHCKDISLRGRMVPSQVVLFPDMKERFIPSIICPHEGKCISTTGRGILQQEVLIPPEEGGGR